MIPVMIYKPLDHISKSIRLVEIHADDAEAPIRCSFHIASLLDCPRYSALSYTWGPKEPTRTIAIDGYSVTIRENLWHALQSIRKKIQSGSSNTIQREFRSDSTEDTLYHWIPQYYWIDAICIQQSNIFERNHQVSLMASIYSQANIVIVWLGLESDGSGQAMSALQIPTFDADNTSLNISLGLLALANRDYWSRVWIVQEVVLAKRLIILCGDMCCDYMPFSIMVFGKTGGLKAENVLRVRHAWTRPDRHLRPDLRYMTLWLGKQNSEDPRDRIYGVLGLLEHGSSRSQLKPDYNKTVYQVFKDVARDTYRTHRGDDVAVIIRSTAEDMLRIPPSRTREIGFQFLETPNTLTTTIGKVLVLKIPRLAQMGMDLLYLDIPLKGLLKVLKKRKGFY